MFLKSGHCFEMLVLNARGLASGPPPSWSPEHILRAAFAVSGPRVAVGFSCADRMAPPESDSLPSGLSLASAALRRGRHEPVDASRVDVDEGPLEASGVSADPAAGLWMWTDARGLGQFQLGYWWVDYFVLRASSLMKL